MALLLIYQSLFIVRTTLERVNLFFSLSCALTFLKFYFHLGTFYFYRQVYYVFLYRVFQMAVKGRGEGNQNFHWGDFFTGWREPEEEWFWRFEPLTKLKTSIFEYWTSVKIKINMTDVSKEYEIKTKMEQEQWLQLKLLFLLGCNLKVVV